jgi:hypothetical protein
MIKGIRFFQQSGELTGEDFKFIAERLKFKFIPE